MTKDEALRLALEALNRGESQLRWAAIATIEEVLAQPEQEPVATINDLSNSKMFTLEANGYSRKDNLYTRPPVAQPEQELLIGCVNHDCDKCKEKNNG